MKKGGVFRTAFGGPCCDKPAPGTNPDIWEERCVTRYAATNTREDFAEVYGLLRRQLSADRDSFTVRALSWLAASEGRPIGYIKLKVILLTFRELGLFGVERLSGEPEIFAFRRIVTRGKVDLTAAAVYRKIMHDFGQD